MGIVIISIIVTAVLLSFLSTGKKWWIRLIAGVLGFILLFATLALPALDPFAVINDTEVEIINLSSCSKDDEIILREQDWQVVNDTINLEVSYKISNLPDGCVYLFVDENNRLYLVKEDSVTVAKFFASGGIDSEQSYSCKAEIIRGDYERIYAEKYETRGETTFWSVGAYLDREYKFYVPEDVSE